MASRIRTTEELRDALKQKLDELKAAFKADAVTLHLYDPQRERLYFPVGVNLLQEQRFMQGVPSMERVAGKIVRSRMPIIAEDAEHHPDLTGPFTHVEKVKTAAGFPLVVPDSGEVMGVLFVDYRRPYQFEEDETERIQSQALEIAEFISRSLQGDQGRMLRDALRMEADFRIEEARLQEIVDRLWDMLGDVDIALWTQERGKRGLRMKMHAGMDRDFVDRVSVNLDTDSSNLVSIAFVDGKEVLIENPQTDPGAIFSVTSPVIWQRMLAVPVSSRYLRLGVLCAFRRERIGFTRRERDLVRAFANLIAVTIENEDRIIALSALHDMGVRLTLATDLGDIMQEVVQSACQVIGADVATVHLYDPVRQEFYDLERSAVFPPESQSDMEKPRGEGGFGARIIKQGRIYCDDVDAQADAITLSTFVREQGIKAYVGTPLISIDESLGVLYVSFKEKRRFSPEDLALIQILANYASTAIYRSGLLDQRTAVMEIARDITSVLDGDKLLQQTLERSLELLNCEIGSISVFDPKTNTLQFRCAVGKPPDMSVRLGEGLIGTAAETRRPVRVRDVRQDDRYVCHVEEAISELDVPMLVGEHLIGVLNAESKRLNAFSEEDQHLAEALAAQAAVAFRTAELYEEAQARLQERVGDIKALQDIYALIGTAPLKDMLEQIAEEAARLTPAKYTGIWLLDERTRELRFGARNRTEEKPTQSWPRLPLDGTSISGQVALTGKTYRCDDVRGDPYYQEWYEDVRSELTTPLVYGGRVIGILDLESTDVGAFTDDHARLVEALAGAAAAAIQNARLYDRLDTLVTVGQAVASTLELDEVLDQILQGSLDALGANYGTLRWLNKATGELALRTHRGEIGDRTNESVRLGEGATGWVAQHGKPLLIGDVREDTRYLKFLAGTRCELAVPIKVKDTTVGVLNVEHPQPYVFDEHDIHLLEAIASQTATAVRNAQLYNAMQTVNEVGQAMTGGIHLREGETLDRLREEEVLELIHSQASKLMDTDNMYIALYDETTDTVRFGLAFVDSRRVDVKTEKGWQSRRAGKGKTEEIVRTKEPLFHATKAEAEEWYAQPRHEEYVGKALPSWLGVPMMVGDKVLGVIATYHPTREYVYSSDDRDVLQAMANQAAIALDNAHMFYDVNRRLEALVDFGQSVTSGIRLREDEVPELIYRQASELMDTSNMYIALYDEAMDTVRFGLAVVDGKHVDVETEEGWQPRRAGKGKTEEIIRIRKSLFHATKVEAEEWYAQPGHEEYIGEKFASWLGVPMMVGEKVLGVIATYHPTRDYVYSGDDLEILQAMADQAAIALENAHMFYDADRRRKVLVEFGQAITSGIRLSEAEVLGLIYEQTSRLMDTNNMSIALYDEAMDTVRFGLVMQDGERIDAEKEPGWGPRPGLAGKGKTNEIIRTKEPILLSTRKEEQEWHTQAEHERYIKEVRASWLGVPMMIGDRVLGVIDIYHLENEYEYGGNDLEILQVLANLAAIALHNAALFRAMRDEQKKAVAAARLATEGAVAADFVHTINNVVGTVPGRVELIRELLGPRTPKYSEIVHHLDSINEDVGSTLKEIQEFGSSVSVQEDLELADIDTLVSTAIQKVVVPSRITIDNKCDKNLPSALVFSGQLVNTLKNMIQNGVEAIESSGSVIIVAKTATTQGQEWVTIEIEDSGCGIPPEDLPQIFERSFSTKPDGMGFALWRAKGLVESLGGKIDVFSEVGKGTTFMIILPVGKVV